MTALCVTQCNYNGGIDILHILFVQHYFYFKVSDCDACNRLAKKEKRGKSSINFTNSAYLHMLRYVHMNK